MDHETVRLWCIVGYGVLGLLAVYSALTFIIGIVSVIKEAPPSKALQLVDISTPRPRGYSIKPDLCEFLVLLVVCWVVWHYSGDAGDMPYHLVRVTAYIAGAWAVFAGLGIAYIVTLRVVVWWTWTQAIVAQHEKRLAEERLEAAAQAAASHPETLPTPAVFSQREERRARRAQARRRWLTARRCEIAVIRSDPWHTTIVLTLLGMAGVLFWTVPPKMGNSVQRYVKSCGGTRGECQQGVPRNVRLMASGTKS